MKFVAAALRENPIVAVWPTLSARALELMTTVGRTVSIEIEGASEPAVLGLPAASVKAFAATETVPGATEVTAGVNMAE